MSEELPPDLFSVVLCSTLRLDHLASPLMLQVIVGETSESRFARLTFTMTLAYTKGGCNAMTTFSVFLPSSSMSLFPQMRKGNCRLTLNYTMRTLQSAPQLNRSAINRAAMFTFAKLSSVFACFEQLICASGFLCLRGIACILSSARCLGYRECA